MEALTRETLAGSRLEATCERIDRLGLVKSTPQGEGNISDPSGSLINDKSTWVPLGTPATRRKCCSLMESNKRTRASSI
jgi:hypothetical protein